MEVEEVVEAEEVVGAEVVGAEEEANLQVLLFASSVLNFTYLYNCQLEPLKDMLPEYARLKDEDRLSSAWSRQPTSYASI